MRRLYSLIAVLVVIIAGLLIYNHTREDRWRPLPGGGKIRWLSVTDEKPPMLHFRAKESIFEPLRKRFGPRWSFLFGQAPLEAGGSVNEPELFVWFQVLGDQSLHDDKWTYSFGLVQGNQFAHSLSGFVSSSKDGKLIGVGFSSEARAQQRLHIRFTKEEQTMDIDIANPLYTSSSSSESKPRTP